jgi:D-3-phosphoglycerate dehydrogenase
MQRVLVAGKLHDAGFDVLKSAGDLDIDYVETIDEPSMQPFLENANAVLLRTQPFSASSIAKCRDLRMVSRHGVGFDSVDVAALNDRQVPLAIVGDVNAQTVAEHAMLLLLSASRRLIQYDAATRPGGNWDFRNSLAAREISGKSLLIIGLGRIGRNLARMAAGFDIRVRAYDPFMKGEVPAGVTMVEDLHGALAAADLISLHVPRTDAPLIGAAEIALMKPTAIIVNTARGGTIDEAALAIALKAGRIFGAGLDVFEDEPLTIANRLTSSPQAILTPHSASMTVECAERMAIAAAKNIVDFMQGRLDPKLVVNAGTINFSQ